MRGYLIFLLSLLSILSYGQGSTVYLRADTIRMERSGGNAELHIKNATRTRTGAFLVNYGNGITGFKYAIDSAWKSGDSLYFRLGPGTLAVFAGGTLVETDPVFSASPAANITYEDYDNWQLAHDKRPDSIRFSGTTTKTMTVYTQDGQNFTASFTDLQGSPTDTTNISNRINAKLNISDTAGMLLPWRNKADTAWSRNIMSAAFTGSATKTLTLTQRNGSIITASFTDSAGAAATAITSGYAAIGTGTGITGYAGNQYAETSTLSTLSLGNRIVGNTGLIDIYSSATVAGKISINNGLNLRHASGAYLFIDNMSGGTGKLSNVSGESFPNSSTFGWTGNAIVRGHVISFVNPATSSKIISGYNSSQNAAAIQSIGPMFTAGQTSDPTSVDGMFWYNSTTNQFKGQRASTVKNFLMTGDAYTISTYVPSSSSDSGGNVGDMTISGGFVYVKTGASAWVRWAVTTSF